MGVGLPSVYAVGSRGRFGEAAAIPSFARPGLAVSDDGDGSVTAVVTGNKLTGGGDQVSRLKYKLAADAAWTVHGTSITGNGTISDLTGLTYDAVYDFLLQPYDSGSGAEGDPAFDGPLRMADSSATSSTSDHDTEQAEDLADMIGTYSSLGEMGSQVLYTAHGVAAAQVAAIVGDETLVLAADRSGKASLYQRNVTFLTTDVTAPDRRDTVTINGDVWEVVDWGLKIGGGIDLAVHRYITVSKGGSPARQPRRG